MSEVKEQRLAYLQWVLKTERTPLLERFACDQNQSFDGMDSRIRRMWATFNEKRKTETVSVAKTGEPYKKWQPPEFLDADFPPLLDSAVEIAPTETNEPARPLADAAPATTVLTAPTTTAKPAPLPMTLLPLLSPLRFSVKNARQNELFDAEIMIEPSTAKPELCAVRFPEELTGLVVEPPLWRIRGTPLRGGEFPLRVEYRDAMGAVRTGTLPFVVNPDPKTLWVDLPSDPDTEFWKKDNTSSSVRGGEARIVAARRRGRSHAHKGTCCDDDYVIDADIAPGWYLAIVADGAGSAKFSRHGSKVATRRAAEFLREALAGPEGEKLRQASENYANAAVWDPESTEGKTLHNSLFVTVGYAAHAAMLALRKEAEASDVIANVKELSTTLLIGLARKVGTRWFCAAYWVGDGAVAVYRQGKEVILLGTPDSGEFSGQTRFLSAEEVQQDALLRRLCFTVVEDMTAFLLMTDGVSDPKFPSETQLGKLSEWEALWQDIDAGARLREEGNAAARLLDWLDFWVPGEYDDRTLAIIH
jgi:hypothetical protein